jgi:hypothetical protein
MTSPAIVENRERSPYQPPRRRASQRSGGTDMTTATVTTEPAAPGMPAPLTPRPDQRERWIAHREPVDFEEAAQLVLDAHVEDGERDDIVAHDLRSWAFGSSDGRTMQLAPVPLPGRPHSPPIAMRDLAFSQLAQRIGAPAQYLKGLPGKLQIACVNYGMTEERQSALLRLAGGEVRAIVSDRYAAIEHPRSEVPHVQSPHIGS